MRWHFLGTSHGSPTVTRHQTVNLIEASGRYYLLDGGPAAHSLILQKGVEPQELSAVFITHMHGDHFGGVPGLMGSSIQFRKKCPDLQFTCYLPGTPKHFEFIVDTLKRYAEATRSYPLDTICFRNYGEGVFFDDGVLKLTAFENGHYSEYCHNAGARSYSFLVECEGKKIFYSGDLSCSAEFADFRLDIADGCDLVVCEAAHFPKEKALPLLKKIRMKEFVFNHVYLIPDGETVAFQKQVSDALGIPCRVLRDGDEWRG